jgi:hypothetical protein
MSWSENATGITSGGSSTSSCPCVTKPAVVVGCIRKLDEITYVILNSRYHYGGDDNEGEAVEGDFGNGSPAVDCSLSISVSLLSIAVGSQNIILEGMNI